MLLLMLYHYLSIFIKKIRKNVNGIMSAIFLKGVKGLIKSKNGRIEK